MVFLTLTCFILLGKIYFKLHRLSDFLGTRTLYFHKATIRRIQWYVLDSGILPMAWSFNQRIIQSHFEA